MEQNKTMLMIRFLATLFVIVCLLFFFHMFNVQSNKNLAESYSNSFTEFIKIDSIGVSTGYFQWTDFLKAVEEKDEESLTAWFEEILSTYSHFKKLEIVDTDFNSNSSNEWYFLGNEGESLYAFFRVYDSDTLDYLQGKLVKAEIDYLAILESIKATEKFDFSTESGEDFVYGIKYTSKGLSYTAYQILIVIITGMIVFILIYMHERSFFGKFRMLHQLDTLVYLADKRLKYSEGHSLNVANLSFFIGKKVGLSKKELEKLYIGAYLHELGVLAVPSEKIERMVTLESNEWDYIKMYPEYSESIIDSFEYFKGCGKIARSINEKWDGSGYPDGLNGEETNILSRIAGVAHLLEVLTRKRVYRETPYDIEEAVEMLGKMSIDPHLLEIVENNCNELEEIIKNQKIK